MSGYLISSFLTLVCGQAVTSIDVENSDSVILFCENLMLSHMTAANWNNPRG